MNIVPYHGTPILEVMVANQDVGFVRTGQRVNIKLSAFPSERFGHVKGMVTHISADATEIAADSWGFSIRIEPESAYLKTADVQHKLRPGMTARVDIITGSRTLISYFFAPIIKTLEDSLGER
jgi:hemolysin D